MKTIIKNMTLLKRLYLNKHDEPFTEDISCIGHFDAIRFTDINNTNNLDRLYLTKGNPNLSNLWQSIINVDKSLNGKFSAISIGLLRFIDDEAEQNKEDAFWKDILDLKDNSNNIKISITQPFYCICLLKLHKADIIKNSSYKNSYDVINKVKNNIDLAIKNNNFKVSMLIYNTYDHADLVVIIKGSNILNVKKAVYCIEKHPFVFITNTIFGAIANENACYDLRNSENFEVGDLILNISSGSLDKARYFCNLIEPEKKCDEQNLRSSTLLSYGENNCLLKVKNITNKEFLDTLKFKIDRSNPAYAFPIHSVQTNIYFKLNLFIDQDDILNGLYPKESIDLPPFSRKCLDMMNKIKDRLDDDNIKKNDNLFNRYITFLKIINTFSQYENNIPGQDLFNLFFPVVSYYYNIITTQGKEIDNFILKDSTAELFSLLDSTINRIIHTEHKFMLVPGYNGMLFDIPIKLCLMYVSFMYKIAEVLNDSEYNPQQNQKIPDYYSLHNIDNVQKTYSKDNKRIPYRFLLIPSIEKKPTTNIDEPYKYSEDKVILVKISQKHLYQPRSLFIILTHEVAHYIGQTMREREFRDKCIIKMIAHIIYDIYFVEYSFSHISKKTFVEYAYEFTYKVLENIDQEDNKKIPREIIVSNAFTVFLTNFCEDCFVNQKIDDLRSDEKYIFTAAKRIYNNYENIQGNVFNLSKKFFVNCREIFADLCSMLILDVDLIYYIEAFRISEGQCIDFVDKPDLDRASIIIYVLKSKNRRYKDEWEKLLNWVASGDNKDFNFKNQNTNDIKNTIKLINDYIITRIKKNKLDIIPKYSKLDMYKDISKIDIGFSSMTTWDLEFDYTSKCYDSINKSLYKYSKYDEENNNLQKIKKLWNCFKAYEVEQDDYEKKSRLIYEFIQDYASIVDKCN